MPLRRALIMTFATCLLAACNSSESADGLSEEAQPVSVPEPVVAPATQPASVVDGTTMAPGNWTVNQNAQGGFAMFGELGADPSLTFDCEIATGVVTLTMARQADAMEAWRLDAGGEAARIDMTPVEGPLPLVAAQIEPSLAIFHAFSDPAGEVFLTSPEGIVTQYPAHPGISSILTACS